MSPENSLRYFNGPPHHVTFQTQLHSNQLHVKTDILPSSHVCLRWTLCKVRQQGKNHRSFIWKHPWQKSTASRQSKIMHMFLKHLKTVELRKINLNLVMKTFFSLSYSVNCVFFHGLLVKNCPQPPHEKNVTNFNNISYKKEARLWLCFAMVGCHTEQLLYQLHESEGSLWG